MKKFFNIFFVTLGAIFLVVIIGAVYFYIADPLNLKPLLFGSTVNQPSNSATSTGSKASGLSAEQKRALESVGINPTTLPTTITKAQETCFIEILGAARVAEIKAGATPSASEIFTAKVCI